MRGKYSWPVAMLWLVLATYSWADYSEHPAVSTFIAEMSAEHDFDAAQLTELFSQVKKQQSILEAIARPAEKTKTWGEYRDIFIQPSRIEKGVAFWRQHADALARAEQTYGVPPQMVVAIIGVETRYGTYTGGYRVIDALTTLGFDYPPRSDFFRKELRHFLLLARDQQRDPLSLTGSYAGAMGYGQFMPSSYRAYAVDFDGDAFIDIWDNPVDAIGSVASYFARHGWEADGPIATRARVAADYQSELLTGKLRLNQTAGALRAGGIEPLLPLADDTEVMAMKLQGKKGAEFWVGMNNFHVITRYNRSQLYAMAVYQLSEAIAQAHDEAGFTTAGESVNQTKTSTIN